MLQDVSRLRDLAVNDSGFLFDPVTGQSFMLNETGLAVLRALKDNRPIEEISAILGQQFELDPADEVTRDIEAFVARLREHGLVR